MERLILDSSVIIHSDRSRDQLLVQMPNDADVAIAAITVADLFYGVELAESKRRTRRQAFVEGFLELVRIEDYTVDAARCHANLLAHTRRSGTSRGTHDLMIAATAVASERTIITLDTRGFNGLPDVDTRNNLI